MISIQVLNQDPTNIYAASGIGMILAEKGALTKVHLFAFHMFKIWIYMYLYFVFFQAKDVFTRLRDASKDDNVDIAINLAHVYLAQNKVRCFLALSNLKFSYEINKTTILTSIWR